MFEQITILGPGLLGASIAMAVRARGLADRVHVWSRRDTTRAKCAQQDWCDAVFETADEAVEGSDLVIVCTPVETIAPLMESVLEALRADAIVTDVGSTKVAICEGMDQLLKGDGPAFIGSHPMAGSERTGMEHARENLFEGAACILTPSEQTLQSARVALTDFWKQLGMSVFEHSPVEHDRIVAHVSHLPHILASTLSSYLASKDPSWIQLSGAGLRDTTRIAAGDAELWRQILSSNQKEVLKALEGFMDELDRLRVLLLPSISEDVSKEVFKFLQKGQKFREGL